MKKEQVGSRQKKLKTYTNSIEKKRSEWYTFTTNVKKG
jgi:hypothetical protein